ncbi:hypothetical protein EV2_002938 [Malus domestica]
MQIWGCFCLLFVFCSVLQLFKRVLQIFLGFLGMECGSCIKFLNQGSDFGCGFFMFGRFLPVFNLLGLFLVFILGLKVLQVGVHSGFFMEFLCDFRGKSRDFRNRVCSRCGSGDDVCSPKVKSLETSPNADCLLLSKNVNAEERDHVDINDGHGDSDGDDESVGYGDDGEFDVFALRKMVKVERRRRNEARVELEKERMAAASAAEEAMAMILRLQNEKSCTEIQAKQYRQMAEQKQQYDEVMFRSMQWIIMKHESERSLLEEQLRLYRQKLQQCLKGDETAAQSQEADPSSNLIENCMDDGLDVDPWEPVRPHL